MKTPASSSVAPVRLAWIACAALALSACTGPGLEPPGDDGANSSGGPGKQADAGAQAHGGSDMHTGTGGRSSTGTSNPSGGSGGKSGGSAGETTPPTTSKDAGMAPADAGVASDAGDEDAG